MSLQPDGSRRRPVRTRGVSGPRNCFSAQLNPSDHRLRPRARQDARADVKCRVLAARRVVPGTCSPRFRASTNRTLSRRVALEAATGDGRSSQAGFGTNAALPPRPALLCRPLDSPAVSTRLDARPVTYDARSSTAVRIPPCPPFFIAGGCTVAAGPWTRVQSGFRATSRLAHGHFVRFRVRILLDVLSILW